MTHVRALEGALDLLAVRELGLPLGLAVDDGVIFRQRPLYCV